ncbi:DUF2292 domain-containing protein [Anaerobacillus sp. HL2]|nr:DUF2292 domain-containing protein [Anaerobacillus sp. HL2]
MTLVVQDGKVIQIRKNENID